MHPSPALKTECDLSWLSMDGGAQGRKRHPGGPSASLPTARNARDKRPQRANPRHPSAGKIREAKDSSEIIRVPRRVEAIAAERPSVERRSTDDDPNARHFTVANVGRNGTVYLRPSRFQVPLTQTPATPPGTADGKREVQEEAVLDQGSRWPSPRTGTWSPRVNASNTIAVNQTVPLPPLSMANGHDRRRTRSHSFSTVDGARTPTFDSNDFQVLLNGRETGRPKSSVDLTDGLLDLRIPHYRLGTPRFSDRGTAYLHNSMYTSNSEDVRSSVFSRADYDKLFPAPPGIEGGRHSTSPYLHPAHAASLTPSRTPPSPTVSPLGGINPAVYDKVEARINDATLVRYSPTTGRIIAATPARLVAQITSPFFLDYELLADFFLTFRSFMSCADILEYMLARMKWALSNDSDSGRIVRVRTFVALRHWILNYFADDFIPAFELRQRFCTLVNGLTSALQRRGDRGGTDMNVIGELKKCWRRTCAKYWPVPNALDTSSDAAILPGDEFPAASHVQSGVSLSASVRRGQSQMDFRRSSIIQLPADVEKSEEGGAVHFQDPQTPTKHIRTASIPTSPMSEDSLTVLSCSVPFLRNVLPLRERQSRPAGPTRNPPHEKAGKPSHGHKRSGSFSDALRDRRPPLPSAQPDSIDLRSLQSLTFTGGLVRGLLLQPSPSRMELLVMTSPPQEYPPSRSSGSNESYFDQTQRAGVRRVVGDVRRALSTRKPRHDSPASSNRSTNSSESRNSGVGQPAEGPSRSAPNVTGWQQLDGNPRVDLLAEKIEGSYREAFQNIDEIAAQKEFQGGVDTQPLLSPTRYDDRSDTLPVTDMKRLNSHVTTGSRSIVIVDDTGVPDVPANLGALPSVSSWSSGMAPTPLFKNAQEAFASWQASQASEAQSQAQTQSGSATAVASEPNRAVSADLQMHDLLTVPDNWAAEVPKDDLASAYTPARKSSSVNPSAFELAPFRNQLRRRPGGDDLKAADRVHDLEPAPRHQHGDSYSTITRSIISDGGRNELSGTHFSGQGFEVPVPLVPRGEGPMALLPTHSSQPNMRPSFQRQVSHLKRMEGEQEDGGIEDALAKLEGKTPTSLTDSDSTAAALPLRSMQGPRSSSMQFARVSAPQKPSDSISKAAIVSPTTDRQGASIYRMSDSEDDEGDVQPRRRILKPTNPDSLMTATSDGCAIESVDLEDFRRGPNTTAGNPPQTPSQKAESPNIPKSGTPQGSFLLDDNESLSDISTEIADHSGDESLGVRSFFFDETPADEIMMPSSFRAPPTPPATVGPSTNVSSTSEPSSNDAGLSTTEKKTLKEAASAPKLSSNKRSDSQFGARPRELRRVHTLPSNPQNIHLPFILAFESDVVAEQLTIIEKDALDEVEWKDLVSLTWQQNPPHTRNWVDFLKKDSNGIDIVIARFNLVVKWVVSQTLLTDGVAARARCITKFIHIASHCHRLRNYASMYQITLALLSADLARLHQTWAIVAPPEKAMLARLEKVCQPLRNFHNLRSEMEAASTPDGEGEACIPFIGLYTHDLMFNAQKPAFIDPPSPSASGRGGGGIGSEQRERLVNFERYQTAAMIVKSLLRLIEASSKYIFRPHPECLSRCLWLAALEDREIVKRSKTLEA